MNGASACRIDYRLDDSRVQQLETSKFTPRVSTGQGVVVFFKTRVAGTCCRSPEGSVYGSTCILKFLMIPTTGMPLTPLKPQAGFSFSHKIAFVSGTKTILLDRKRPIFDLAFFVFDLA